MSTKKQDFLQSLDNIGLSAQVHGIPRIVGSKQLFLKLIWIVSFLASGLVCLYFLQRSIKSFFEYPIVTNIDLVYENPLIFPTVTICSLNPTIKSYNLSETVFYCYFNNIDCSIEPYFVKIPNQYQQYKTCYQFNKGYENTPIFNITKSGLYNGLMISLFDGLFDEPRNDFLRRYNSTGFEVFLNNKSDLVDNNGIIIPPGYTTVIKIKKVVNTKLTEPYNNCIKDLSTFHNFDSSFYTQILHTNKTYTQKNCLDYAFSKTINCSTTYDKLLAGCELNDLNDLNVFNNFLSAYYNFYSNNVYSKYLDKCPLECDTIWFQTTVSHAYFPSNEHYYRLLKNDRFISKFPKRNNTSIDDLRKSIYDLIIFFEDLTVTQISQQPKFDIWDLISGIGGLFGLFLGFSFLSLIDIVHIIVEFFTIFCVSDSKNKVNPI